MNKSWKRQHSLESALLFPSLVVNCFKKFEAAAAIQNFLRRAADRRAGRHETDHQAAIKTHQTQLHQSPLNYPERTGTDSTGRTNTSTKHHTSCPTRVGLHFNSHRDVDAQWELPPGSWGLIIPLWLWLMPSVTVSPHRNSPPAVLLRINTPAVSSDVALLTFHQLLFPGVLYPGERHVQNTDDGLLQITVSPE